MRITAVPLAIATALLVATPSLVQAQMFNQIGGGSRQDQKPPPKAVLPPGLPGASSSATPAPARNTPTDLEPNDALFDAINRGDIGAARDAINRGADLHGQNVLGMTPLELSVDLGRNDISFLLLSMRGGDNGQRLQAQAQTSRGAGKPTSKKQARQQPARPAARTVAAAPTPSQTAHLFAGDGGTPNPNAGFLGFDSGRR